jgi:thiamine-phosphate pyrophosphorylase
LGGSTGLWRAAATLGRTRRAGKGLPTAWFVTDPGRTPDPAAVVERLPRGAGVIFRGFGRADAAETALQLAKIARRRGLILLIGADEALAARVGANGVHLPERMGEGLRRLRARRPGWIITLAAHSPRALQRAAALSADAVLFSTVFASLSATAGAPMGPTRLARLARRGSMPVFALGGVNAQTAKRLARTGVAGFAAVDAFARTIRT